jgi:hypothetical protein
VKKKAIQKDISYSAVIETCIENYLNQIAWPHKNFSTTAPVPSPSTKR